MKKEQRRGKVNQTGIPRQTKAKFETLSGRSFDDVQVHYNSNKPAKLGALAYTYGTHVYLAPGQSQHLDHELAHVLQQKAGLVRPTAQMRGLPVNTSPELERSADQISRAANSGFLQTMQIPQTDSLPCPGVIQRLRIQIDEQNIVDSSESKKWVDYIYDNWVIPYFNASGFQFFRIHFLVRKFLSEYAENDCILDEVDFMSEFVNYLETQTIRVGRNEIPALRPLNIETMARPRWPKNLRTELEKFQADQLHQTNIRHVIRNYLLKRSLVVAEERFGLEAVGQLAREILDSDNLEDATVIRQLYHTLYLNIKNLWIGDALVNQVIGFLATPLTEFGEELQQDLDFEVTSYDTIRLQSILFNSVARLFKKHSDVQEQIWDILEQCYLLILDYIQNVSSYRFDVGMLISDIGNSFGFDFPNDRSEQTAARTERLIHTATRLETFLANEDADLPFLLETYQLFLN